MVATKHLGARLHRMVYGLFRKTDREESLALYKRVKHLLSSNALGSNYQINELADRIARDVADTLQLSEQRLGEVRSFVRQLIAYEGMFDLPDIDLNETRTIAQYWELNRDLETLKSKLEKIPAIIDALTAFSLECIAALNRQLGEVPADEGADGITVPTRRIDRVSDLPQTVEKLALAAFDDDFEKLGLFTRLRQRLETNLVVASGGNPRDVEGFSKAYRMPGDYKAKSAHDLVGAYLSGTPLLQLFEGEEIFVIPQWARFEHHHIIAGSGHGKTQTLQYMIGKDLAAVASGNQSIVVIDSQGDLIRKVANLRYFARGQPLQNRICIIDPTDIEWPVSLNLFDVGLERLRNYPMLERERLTNSILELYDFVLGSLLSAEMTQKQNVVFRYVTRLMLHIPDATIHTLRELMEKGSEVRFAEHIVKLEGTARHFFETEFPSKEFAQTRQQVLRRLWGILENQTFERMFSHPRSKLDLFAEMNAGKVILINTAKDLLKESGTEIFGRFFVAMIAQAAQERAVLPESRRMPTLVYVDEAADYFDRNISVILSQARKYKVGMVLAHQYLGQLDPKLQEAFSANTAIKFAGGFTGREARSAAQMLNCDPALIEGQPKGSFAAFIRGVTPSAIPLKFPFGKLEELPTMTSGEKADLHDRMRDKYAVHFTELRKARAGNGSGDRQADGGDRSYPEDDSDSGFQDAGRSRRGGNASRNANDDDPDNPDTSPGPKW